MQKITEKLKEKKDNLPSFLIVVFYLLFVVIFISCCEKTLDSDMSSEMVLANLLNDEHTLISENWSYGNELRVFSMQLLFKLFLYIFPNNWLYARYASQLLIMLLYVVSAIFCVYNIGFGKRAVYIAAILILPISFWNVFYNYFGGFYLMFSIPTLFLIGLVFRISCKEKLDKKLLIVLSVVSLLVGMNGMKVILYFCIPCIFTAVIMFIFALASIDKNNYKESFEYKYLIVSIISAVFLFVGFVIYNLLLKLYPNESIRSFAWNDFDLNALLKNISYFLWNLGYPGNELFKFYVTPMNIKGIFGVFSIVTITAFIISIIRLTKKYNELSTTNKYIFVLSISAIFITIFILTFTLSVASGSYYLPLIPFVFILIELEISTEDFTFGWIKNVLRFCLIMAVALSSITNLGLYVKYHPRRNSSIDKAIVYLENADIDCIFAKFWDGNVVTELTNGKVKAYVVNDIHSLEMIKYLQEKKHFEPYNGEVYVLLDDEIKINESYRKDGIEIVFCDEYSLIKAKDIDTYKNNINDIIISEAD